MKSLQTSKYYKDDGNDNNDEDDDRKPPARILFVTPSPAAAAAAARNNNKKNDANHQPTTPTTTATTSDGEQLSLEDTTASSSTTIDNQQQQRHAAAAAAAAATTNSPAVVVASTLPSAVMTPSSPSTERKNTNDNKQQKQQQQLIRYNNSSDESSSSSTTTSVFSSGQQQQQHQDSTRQRRRRRLLVGEELVLLSGTAVLSLGTFVYLVLPTTALVALGLFLSSLALTVYTLQQAVVQEFQTAIQTTGVGRYLLPTWLYDMLTQQSLHEFMTDPSFALEYRHLLLYFLPGISPERLHTYLQQLAPHHIQGLYRPGGVGHLVLGPTWMRILVGEEGMPTNQQQQQQQRIGSNNSNNDDTVGLLPLPNNATPTRLLLNDSSNNNNNNNNNHIKADADTENESVSIDSSAASTTPSPNNNIVATPLPPSPGRAPIPSELQDAYNQEERVLTNALSDTAYSAVWQPAVSYLAYLLRRYARPVTQRIVWYGFGLSFVSSSVGLLGRYTPPSPSRLLGLLSSRWTLPVAVVSTQGQGQRSISRRTEDSMAHFIWTTALLSGATAMVTLGLQHWYLYSPQDDNGEDSSSSQKKKRAVSKKG